ncbi:MAG: N-acetylmuramoyl-L-alanine amidase, partial [Thermomicrobium sp.]|nr:N-acetylmuramoyl-L-alanine amidase [Thermomicrobium sp.]
MRGLHLTRRTLLRIAGSAVVATVTQFRSLQADASELTRTTWLVEGPFPTAGQLSTPVYPLPSPFTSVEVSWRVSLPNGAIFSVSLRIAQSDGTWSEWIPLEQDPHTPPRQDDGWIYAP